MMAGFNFGAPPQNTSFGTFGTTQQPVQSTQSFNFGTPAKTTASAFGLGLGTTTSASQPFGTSFGTTFGGFGTTTSAPSASSFSFGTTTAPSSFNFGGATTTAPSLFGGLGTSTFPSLGSVTTTAPATTSGFSFGPGLGAFGATTTPSNTFMGGLPFGSSLGGTGTTLGAGQSTLQFAATANVNNVTNLVAALSLPTVFGDERDAILAKWNQLQAFWGSGKGFYLSSAPPVEFTPENPFCRFKAIGYSCLPTAKSEDGLVGLNLKKKESEVRNQQQHLVASLHKLFGSNPNISVCVDGIKSIPGDKTEVVIYLQERTPTGISRRIPTTDVVAYLEQPSVKPSLGGLSILALVPKAALSKEQLKQYLDNPPAGVDPLLWQQAKLDNPDPRKLIPVAMTGFSELLSRLQCQEQETKQHQERLDVIADEISELQKKHATTVAKITEHKRKQLDLGHRVLKVMVNQEVNRKMGFAIQADEEQLRVQLEAIQAELSAPTQFKGRLNELMSQIRMQNQKQVLGRSEEHYNLDSCAKDEFQQYLNYQQEGIVHLVSIIKDDTEDLNVIKDGLKEVLDRRRKT